GFHDELKDRVILARDHLGKKPLFYTVHEGRLIYSSEIKAILQFPGINRELNPESLAQLMFYSFVPAPKTLFRNIFVLPQGHYLIFENGKTEVKRFWNLA